MGGLINCVSPLSANKDVFNLISPTSNIINNNSYASNLLSNFNGTLNTTNNNSNNNSNNNNQNNLLNGINALGNSNNIN